MPKEYVLMFCLSCFLIPLSASYAMSDDGKTSKTDVHHTDHPPHNHQHNDHIKKLDEGVQRRKNKKLN